MPGSKGGRCQSIAERQGEQRVCRAAVTDELPVIPIQRACPPSAGRALVGEEPRDAPLDTRIAARHSCFAQSDDRESSHVAVAGWIGKLEFGAELLCAIALAPLFGKGEVTDRPSTIG